MRFSSLRVKFGLFFLAVTIPLAVLLVLQNFHAIQVVEKQVAESERKVLLLFLRQVNQSLDSVENYLISLVYEDPSLPVLNQDTGNAFQLAEIQLFNRFSDASLAYPVLGGLFASLPSDELLLVPNTARPLTLAAKDELEGALRSRGAVGENGWTLARIGGRSLIFRSLRSDRVVVGAWIDVTALLSPVDLPVGNSVFLLRDAAGEIYPERPEVGANAVDLNPGGEPYQLSGRPVRWLVTGESSDRGAFRLVSLLPEKELLQSLPTLRILNGVVAAAVALLLALFFLILRRTVLTPLGALSRAMERLQTGDWGTRIITTGSSREFELLIQTFNAMVAQINQLKIHVYEEQLHAHKAELLFLRLQINPHFFLNSLNILYQMAEVKNFALIQELTRSLSKYFQFMFRSNSDFVLLVEEWEHVKNYLRIQELRFPKRLRCHFDAPDPMPAVEIPPLLIQAFVENSIKHAFNQETGLDLGISVRLNAESGCVQIVVEDSGPGFSPEALEALGRGGSLESADHIGIANTQRRLTLLYGERAELILANRENGRGARVEVLLPSSRS